MGTYGPRMSADAAPVVDEGDEDEDDDHENFDHREPVFGFSCEGRES